MSEDHGTQALWPQMIAALAAIDDALGLPDDGCNSTAQTLDAIRQLRADLAAAQAMGKRLRDALSRCRFDSLNMSAADLEFIRAAYAAKSDDSALREMIEAAKAEEREAIITEMPGGHSVDPQWVCDMIRARGAQ